MLSRSFGLVIAPELMRSSSRTRRALTCSTSASAFDCALVEIADLGVGLDALPVELVDPGLELGDARVLWERGPAVVELGERGVLGLQVEQGQLGGRFGVQRVLLVLEMACVHGSVTIVDTLVSTVSPHRAATSRAATGSQVHSAAQCGTSMTAQASGRSACSLTGW